MNRFSQIVLASSIAACGHAASLVAIPGDDRALSELSWAALSFGDFAKAHLSAEQSVRNSSSPMIKAASHYNLGRVLEAEGKFDQAKVHYESSLALRVNATVQDRLAKLPKVEVKPSELTCSKQAMTERDLCSCFATAHSFKGACDIDPIVDRFSMLSVAISDVGEESKFLIYEDKAKFRVVASLGDVYNPGMMGINEQWQLGKSDKRSLQGKTVYQFATSHERSDVDAGVNEVEFVTTNSLVMCVVNEQGAVHCPLTVPVLSKYERDTLMDDEQVEADVKDLKTIREEFAISTTITEQGVVQLRAAKGKPDPGLLGDKPLW